MKKFVSEALEDILKPKTPGEVTIEIERRISGKNLDIIKQTADFKIYQVQKAEDIKEIIRTFGGRDEDIFFNFYLILDNSTQGFKQVIGIKVSPDGNINAMDANGKKVEDGYLSKFN